MNIQETKQKLSQHLFCGMMSIWNKVKNALPSSNVYSFVLYSASGLPSFCCVANTTEELSVIAKKLDDLNKENLELLKEHPDLLDMYSSESKENYFYAEVSACEWPHFFYDEQEFIRASKLIEDLYEWSEENSNDFNVVDEVMPAIKEAVLNFRAHFNIQDLLLGFQYSDPDEKETKRMLDISKSVNSDHWYKKTEQIWMET